ncbi:MAG: phage tail terminator-like protein [Raoultibacter sp.]
MDNPIDHFAWITDAINSQLNKAISGIPIAWPNLTYEPTVGEAWCKAMVVPTSEYGVTCGDTGENNITGMLQVQINTAINTGITESNRIKALIANSFRLGLHLPAPEDCHLRITGQDYSSGGQTSLNDFTKGGTENDWSVDFITIYWSARKPRN